VVQAYKDAVIPHAALVTPNAQEAALLAEVPVRSLDDAREAAERIVALGANSVLVKGGHLEGSDRGTDLLLHEGTVTELAAVEVVPGRFHGTGCALSAAIASRMAFGQDIPGAVEGAKAWLTGALAHAFAIGRGAKPVNHSWPLDDKP
jgi:hydroxymethylpyrimidine/phosphomethylpyrimidine kinase